MYQAELQGKLSSDLENKEDILTSNVFSFFKYADRKIFLRQFLENIGIKVTAKEAEQAVFDFWPTYEDHTEPDLILIVGDYYILVEAKFLSGFGQERGTIQHQLVREYQGGNLEAKLLNKNFVLVAITADPFYTPSKFTGVPNKIVEQLIWTNWQMVAILIEETLRKHPNLPSETRVFAEDLMALLIKKGLRNYIGKQAFHFKKDLKPINSNYFFFNAETVKYEGGFSGFEALIYSELIHESPTIFFTPHTSTYFSDIYQIYEIEEINSELFFGR